MAWNGSVRTHYNQIAQGGEQGNLFFALGFNLSLMLWYRLFLTKPRYRRFCSKSVSRFLYNRFEKSFRNAWLKARNDMLNIAKKQVPLFVEQRF